MAMKKVGFTPNNGHFDGYRKRSAFDPKRTLDVASSFDNGVSAVMSIESVVWAADRGPIAKASYRSSKRCYYSDQLPLR